MTNLWALGAGGLGAGILAGFLGIGGGTVLVPLQVSLGIPPIQAVATSNLSIVLTSLAGSIQNWRMGLLDIRRVFWLGIPAVLTAQIGTLIANRIPVYVLLGAFGMLLLANSYLVELRKQLAQTEKPGIPLPLWVARSVTGGSAGLLAGLFGVGGGVIMVPLQILLLQESIKAAIQTSLGAIVITAITATSSHAGLTDWIAKGLGWGDGIVRQNVLWIPGLVLGLGGLMGVQVSTRLLPRLPDERVSLIFRSFLFLLALYVFWQAWQSYQGE